MIIRMSAATVGTAVIFVPILCPRYLRAEEAGGWKLSDEDQ
jgi:hypothetical protein